MFYMLYFKNLGDSKKLNYLRTHGSVIGERIGNGRKIFVYLVRDFFVEVVYKNDNSENDSEKLMTFPNVQSLNSYLAKEFMTSN
jgi:hypothetical protein